MNQVARQRCIDQAAKLLYDPLMPRRPLAGNMDAVGLKCAVRFNILFSFRIIARIHQVGADPGNNELLIEHGKEQHRRRAQEHRAHHAMRRDPRG